MNHWTLALGALVLSMGSASAWADDPTLDCLSQVAQSKDFGHLGSKLVLPLGGQPSMRMLADQSRPSADEKIVIDAWESASERCYELGSSYRVSHHGAAVARVMDQSIYVEKELVAQLYSGQLSYGDFNKTRWAKMKEYDQAIAALDSVSPSTPPLADTAPAADALGAWASQHSSARPNQPSQDPQMAEAADGQSSAYFDPNASFMGPDSQPSRPQWNGLDAAGRSAQRAPDPMSDMAPSSDLRARQGAAVAAVIIQAIVTGICDSRRHGC